MPPLQIDAAEEVWPIAGTFTISRGSRTEARVVVVRISDGRHTGCGEATPYARYGETTDSVIVAIRGAAQAALDHATLARLLPAGAARNALDCALWDLAAKRAGRPVHELLGLPAPEPLVTAYTLSLDTADAMAARARAASDKPLLKLKLGGPDDATRLRAVRAARPDARIVVDANEGWREADLPALFAVAAATGVELIEQPLPAGHDAALAAIPHPVPICADESVHTAADLAALGGRYDAINVKLDKAGGLTEALALAKAARAHGFKIMVGCMVATSLAMAPALLVAQSADWVDLDGPLLLARDRPHGLIYAAATVHPAQAALWG